jgi:clan AA aspartic protease (TIGR02281 family)
MRSYAVLATMSFVAGIWVASLATERKIAPPADDGPIAAAAHRLRTRIENNRCVVDGHANNSPFSFILDTGADGPYFTTDHARALGYDPAQLRHDHSYRDWIGTVQGTNIRLRELRIGEFVLNDVSAAIDESGFRQPLLGMSVLKLLHLRLEAAVVASALVGGRLLWTGKIEAVAAKAAGTAEEVELHRLLSSFSWGKGDSAPKVFSVGGTDMWVIISGDIDARSHSDAHGQAIERQCLRLYAEKAVRDAGAYLTPHPYNFIGAMMWPERADECRMPGTSKTQPRN